ncbi:MAG: Ni/Fe-hydrogenase cytochrome b subunit [Calditrichae bacterium]|nr:Ni/Fe-hydrogenase cytochrome b subunit [Calditrichota bacterium]MCB9056972.1 Ni/Fe-hydrogenase cytochrome b subunit [Calditrichia bacterium]
MKVNAAPMNQKIWTPWFTVGVIFIALGAIVTLYRFIFGIGAVTNLSDGVPWGIWIAFDVVTGIALAAGGFTMAALIYIFNRGQYSPLVRPALITALLGYGIAAFSIMLDVGRWWQLYNPLLPRSWQGNSPLFEVSLCVMTYLTVLILEFVPIAAEKYKDSDNAFLKSLANKLGPVVNKALLFLIILGVVISTLHQSSLGSVMLVAVARIHPLWHTAWLPFLFLVSAIAVGFPVVVIESFVSAKAFKRSFEAGILSKLVKVTPWFLAIYGVVRYSDIIISGKAGYLLSGWGLLFIVENLMLIIIPFFMFINQKARTSPNGLLIASVIMVVGLVLNRLNTYLITYSPRPGWDYFPSIGELLVSAMLISLLFVGYKILANNFPVLSKEH